MKSRSYNATRVNIRLSKGIGDAKYLRMNGHSIVTLVRDLQQSEFNLEPQYSMEKVLVI